VNPQWAKERRDRSRCPKQKRAAASVKSLPGSLSMEGVLDRGSRCHSTWRLVEAISIGRVETASRTAGAVETRLVTRRQRSALNARVSEPRTFARRGRKSRPKRTSLPLKHEVRRSVRASCSSTERQPQRARVLVFDNVGCRVRPNASFGLRTRDRKIRGPKLDSPTGAEVPSTGYRGASRVNGRVVNHSPRVDNRARGFRRRRASTQLRARTKTLRIVCSILFNRSM
jgi:hypothetical protein